MLQLPRRDEPGHGHAFEASAMAPGDCGAVNVGGGEVFRIGEIVAEAP